MKVSICILGLIVAAGCEFRSTTVIKTTPPPKGQGVSVETSEPSGESAAPPSLATPGAPASAPAENPSEPAATAAPPGDPPMYSNPNAEARRKRNLEWLRILNSGTPQQKQKVQEQFTRLSSVELQELTELYEKQQNK